MARNYVTKVRSNDTLQSIAHRFTGDANRWHDIVAVNNHLPKKNSVVNGKHVSTLSNIFIGQNLVLPNHWFGNVNPWTWDSIINDINYGPQSYVVMYAFIAASKYIELTNDSSLTNITSIENKIRNRWDRPMSVLAEYFNHPEWMQNVQSKPFIIPTDSSGIRFWIWFLSQIGLGTNLISYIPPQTQVVGQISSVNNPFVTHNVFVKNKPTPPSSRWYVCPTGYTWDPQTQKCVPESLVDIGNVSVGTGQIGCGSSCTAQQIKNGTCKDFSMKRFMSQTGLSGPPSDGSLGCGGGGCGSTANTSHHGCASCGAQPNGCGYPFGPDSPGPIGNGCSSCSFDYLCDYPFDNGGSICPMPYGAFGGGANPNGVINGPPEDGQIGIVYDNGQVGCGECGRWRNELYLQGTVGDTDIQGTVGDTNIQGTVGDAPTQDDIQKQLQAFMSMNPADCEKQISDALKASYGTPEGKAAYDALVKKYGSEDELKARLNIVGQAFCGEQLKNINPQAPYKNTTGLLWLGGTLVGGIIAGVLVGKIL